MSPRSARETLDSLRITLQKLEQTNDATSDVQDATELKQILLNRIAELETLQALLPQEDVPQAPSPAELPPLALTEEERPATEGTDAAALQQLD